jgi:hypothetical protein
MFNDDAESVQVMGVALGMCRPPALSQCESRDDDDEEEAAAPTSDGEGVKSCMHVVNTRGLDHTALHLLCLHR